MKRNLLGLMILFLVAATAFSQAPLPEEKNLYRNLDHKFRVIFPPDWRVGKGAGPNTPVKALDGGGAWIAVTVESAEELTAFDFGKFSQSDTEGYAAEVMQYQTNNWQTSKILDVQKTRIGGKPAIQIKWRGTRSTVMGDLDRTFFQYQVINNHRVFTITCGSPSEKFEGYRPVFLRCIFTFTFEEDLPPPKQ